MIARTHLLGSIAAVAALAAALTASCGGDGSPVTPTPTTTTTLATQPPATGSCSLGPGSVNAECAYDDPRLTRPLDTAIDLVVAERPGLVDTTQALPRNSDQYRVLNREAFIDTVVENLRRQGLCAERDADSVGLRRILVKNSNESSETYDVVTDDSFMRRREAAYVASCFPASFPIDRTADMPPAGLGCGRPYPPPVSSFACKVHLRAAPYYTVDATPIVGPDRAYCTAVGFAGRQVCPVRPEGAPDREVCEQWRVGRARDTGRVGPTWTALVESPAGSPDIPCSGPESNCSNDPDNQYQVRVYHTGRVRARAENGAECVLLVER